MPNQIVSGISGAQGIGGGMATSQTSAGGAGVVTVSSGGGGGIPTAMTIGGGLGQMATESQVLDKHRLNELVKEVDPSEQLDDEVEDVLLQIADDFIEQTVSQACALAKHRKANTIDVRDVQLVLERSWNMWIPGFGQQELRPYKRSAQTDAHKQRLAVIKKSLKKY
jgi:transcription initiation factor TFIID subunit 12